MAVVTVDYTGMQGHVYTLLLEGGHYYVGWSSSVEHRIAQHFSGTGSRWTTRHPAVQVLTCVAGDTRLEDVVTISLMCQHGWQKVRGGRWCQMLLEGPPDAVRRALANAKTRSEPERPTSEEEGPALAPLTNEHQETITLTRSKPDGEAAAWRAEIWSAQAATECAKRGFKCIYGATLQEAASKITEWRADSEVPAESAG